MGSGEIGFARNLEEAVDGGNACRGFSGYSVIKGCMGSSPGSMVGMNANVYKFCNRCLTCAAYHGGK